MRFFLSYAHADQGFARRLAAMLQARGAQVWVDFLEMRVGDSLVQRITDAVADADFVIAVVSEASVGSAWCHKELAIATSEGLREGKVRVLPVRLSDVQLPASLRDTYYLSSSGKDAEDIARRVLRDARQHAGQAGQADSDRTATDSFPLSDEQVFVARQMAQKLSEEEAALRFAAWTATGQDVPYVIRKRNQAKRTHASKHDINEWRRVRNGLLARYKDQRSVAEALADHYEASGTAN